MDLLCTDNALSGIMRAYTMVSCCVEEVGSDTDTYHGKEHDPIVGSPCLLNDKHSGHDTQTKADEAENKKDDTDNPYQRCAIARWRVASMLGVTLNH